MKKYQCVGRSAKLAAALSVGVAFLSSLAIAATSSPPPRAAFAPRPVPTAHITLPTVTIVGKRDKEDDVFATSPANSEPHQDVASSNLAP